jgi:hypothetical protein
VAVQASQAEIIRIRANWSMYLNLGEQVESRMIRAAELLRILGLDLQGLCAHEQMDFSFFKRIEAELPERLTFQAVRTCMAIARAHPKPITDLKEANRLKQTLFEVGGFLESPTRATEQIAHTETPYVRFVNTFKSAQDKLTKELAGVEQWDIDMRIKVREQVRKFEAWAHETAEKL